MWDYAYACGYAFKGSRKIGKVHQNVLVFVKGNPKIAAEYCGDVDVYIPNEDN